MPDDPAQRRVFLFFAAAALLTLWWLWHRRAALRRRHLDLTDRRLAGCIAAFVLYPLTVLVHEWGHVLAVRATGGEVVEIQWSLIEGAVLSRGPDSAAASWFVAAAGPAAGALAALVLGTIAWRGERLPMLVRLACMLAAAIAGVHNLVLYPLLAADGAGDFAVVYGEPSPMALRAAGVAVHVAALVHLCRGGRAHFDALLRRAG